MASARGRAGDHLIRKLLEEGYRFEYFQAVRIIEQLFPERSPVGADGPPSREAVRLRPTLSFNFPSSTLFEVLDRRAEDDAPPFELLVQFMGLYGVKGVLPWHYTQMLLDQERRKQYSLRDFLDIFNHRLLSFFHRSWVKYRYPVQFLPDGSDRLSRYLLAFLGLGTRGLRGRTGIPDARLLAYAGLFAQPRSAAALQSLLGDFLETRVRVVQFDGEWVALPPADQNRLGISGRNHRLGRSLTLGRRVWSRQHRFRVVVGPISARRFLELLPGREGFRQMAALTRLYAGLEHAFSFHLLLERGSGLSARLGGGDAASRLGWTSWLGSGEPPRGERSAVFAGETSP